MRPVLWIIPCAVGIWPILGVGRAHARHGGRSFTSFETTLVDTGWVSPAGVPARRDVALAKQPPVGEGAYRPSHHTVASVIVAFRRARVVRISRLGGLHGP